jgi:hypothetical protein
MIKEAAISLLDELFSQSVDVDSNIRQQML